MTVVSNILDEIHEGLDPDVFDDAKAKEPKLKPAHRKWIIARVEQTLEKAGYKDHRKWLGLVLTGSLTTYQYSDESDVDISLFVDSDRFPDWSRAEMIGVVVEHIDGTKLPGTPHPMQGFVVPPEVKREDLYAPGLRSGYDLYKDEWIVPPEKGRSHDVKSEYNGYYIYALESADKMQRLLEHEPEKAKLFWRQIHQRRRRDQKRGKGDFAEANIVYKFLANRGLMPEISDLTGDYIAKVAALDNQAVLDANAGKDLRGLPQRVNVPNAGPLTFHSHKDIQSIAQDYNRKHGIQTSHPTDYVKVNPSHAARIADAYGQMSHAPDDPEVKSSYDALKAETMAQYRHATDRGYQFDFYPEGRDPYPNSPREAVLDLHHNKHMYVYPTHDGFGSGDDVPSDHPMLEDTGMKWGGKPVTYNDLFRSAHDFYGHAKEGLGFRADGEDNAYRQHSAMFSPLARRAMAAETRGQNSYVNFGPHGENNQTATTENTVFAPQKAGLLPSWTEDPNIHQTSDDSHEASWNFEAHTRISIPADEGWWDTRKPFGKSPSNYLYHATTPDRVQHIMQHGLVPWDEHEMGSPYISPEGDEDMFYAPRPGHVYLAEGQHKAEQYAKSYGPDSVLLRVNRKALDPKHINPDEDSSGHNTFGDINEDEDDEDGFGEPGHMSLGDWAENTGYGDNVEDTHAGIAKSNTLAYRGTIPPHAITPLYPQKTPGIGMTPPQTSWEPKSSHWDLSKIALNVNATLPQIAYDATKAHGGVTIGLNGVQPTTGFAFSPYHEAEFVVPAAEFSTDTVDQYVGAHMDQLSAPNNYLGVWKDGNEIYLDVSQVHEDRETAMKAAEQANQQAIFDLTNFQEIPVQKVAVQETEPEVPNHLNEVKFVEQNGRKYWAVPDEDMFHSDIIERHNLDPSVPTRAGRKHYQRGVEYSSSNWNPDKTHWNFSHLSAAPKQVAKFVYHPQTNRMLVGEMANEEGEALSHHQLSQHLGIEPQEGWYGQVSDKGWGQHLLRTKRFGPDKSEHNPYETQYRVEQAAQDAIPGAKFPNPIEQLNPKWGEGSPEVSYVGKQPEIAGAEPYREWDFS